MGNITKRFTTVVYLLNQPVMEMTLPPGGLAELLLGPPDITPREGTFTVSSMASQFQLNLKPMRADFVDRSEILPARTDFPARVVAVADYIGLINGLKYSAVGLNFSIGIQREGTDPASRLILQKFVKQDALLPAGKELQGASVRLWYTAQDPRRYLYIEPEGNSYDTVHISAHLNVHFDITSPPKAEWMSSTIKKEYSDFLDLLTKALGS